MRKSLLWAAVVGFIFAISVTLWVSLRGDQEVLDENKEWSLSQIAAKRKEQKSNIEAPLPSLEEVSKSLGLASVEEALRHAVAFKKRIESGFLPKDWKNTCASEFSPLFCENIQEYFDYYKEKERSDRLKKSKPKNHMAKIPKKFDKKAIDALQTENFASLWRRFPEHWKFSDFTRIKTQVLASPHCPHNLSLVLARKLESFLKEPQAWELLKEFDAHGRVCLDDQDSNAEFLFLRQALLNWSFGNESDQKIALELVQKATQLPVKREEYRTLYWTWKLQKRLGLKEASKDSFKKLTLQHPTSFYSVLAWVEEGTDPLKVLEQASSIKDVSEASDYNLNRSLGWLKLMLYTSDSEFACQKFGAYLVQRLRSSKEEPGLYQYLARLFHKTGLHRLQISLLSQFLSEQPRYLSFEFMRLLYPMPFFKNFEKHMTDLDTALILGLARQESGFDPRAHSGADAQGLLQLLPSTAKLVRKMAHVKKGELYDYAHNIELGSYYLKKRIQQFDGSVERALAAYNAGASNVEDWTERLTAIKDTLVFVDLIPYRETRDYVPFILRNAYWYHRLYPELTQDLNRNKAQTSELLQRALFPKEL